MCDNHHLTHARNGQQENGNAKLQIQALICGLEELADVGYQERVWAGNGRGEMSSFEEALTTTFDNSRLDQILYTGLGTDQLSPQMLALARRLNIAVQKVPQLVSPAEVLRHPAMVDIRSLARELLALIERSYREHADLS